MSRLSVNAYFREESVALNYSGNILREDLLSERVLLEVTHY